MKNFEKVEVIKTTDKRRRQATRLEKCLRLRKKTRCPILDQKLRREWR